jgi:hypothetical protein
MSHFIYCLAKCHYAECRYAECREALLSSTNASKYEIFKHDPISIFINFKIFTVKITDSHWFIAQAPVLWQY